MFDCFVFFFVLSLFSERFVLAAASVLHFTYFYGYYSQSSLVATKTVEFYIFTLHTYGSSGVI